MFKSTPNALFGIWRVLCLNPTYIYIQSDYQTHVNTIKYHLLFKNLYVILKTYPEHYTPSIYAEDNQGPMKHTTRIELVNLKDLNLAEASVIDPEEVRRITVENAVVDTGASRLFLPKSLVEQLGLTPVGSRKAQTTNGIVDRFIYSPVQFTVLERSGIIEVTDIPENVPVLVGNMILEMLDLCLDIKKGLIYNPDHDDEWIEDQL
ncbi:MAG: aspartyl protease family protein [Candidatus Poribacteria bacterium]|nr:aspartyl protease family protein [Candidatus Poribacteria bacterium]